MNRTIKYFVTFFLMMPVMCWAASEENSKSPLQACHKKPSFLLTSKNEIIGGFDKLPKMIFVGREAHYYIEGKEKTGVPFRLHGMQTFKTPVSRLLCANSSGSEAMGFSIYAPTLIDLSEKKSVGHAFWQFQITSTAKDFGIWNHQSKMIKAEPSLEEKLKHMGVEFKIYQTYFNEYLIVFTRKTESYQEYLALTYDAVASLD